MLCELCDGFGGKPHIDPGSSVAVQCHKRLEDGRKLAVDNLDPAAATNCVLQEVVIAAFKAQRFLARHFYGHGLNNVDASMASGSRKQVDDDNVPVAANIFPVKDGDRD